MHIIGNKRSEVDCQSHRKISVNATTTIVAIDKKKHRELHKIKLRNLFLPSSQLMDSPGLCESPSLTLANSNKPKNNELLHELGSSLLPLAAAVADLVALDEAHSCHTPPGGFIPTSKDNEAKIAAKIPMPFFNEPTNFSLLATEPRCC